MSNPIETILRKVRALRELAKSANVHEAAVAAAKADRLIQKHRLDEAAIEAAGYTAEAPTRDPEGVYFGERQVVWKKTLLLILVQHYGCASFNERLATAIGWTTYVVGRPSDTAIVRYMFAWVTSEIVRLLGASGFTERKSRASFCKGAVMGFYEALETSAKEARAQATSTAPVLLDGRSKEAERTVVALCPGIEPAKKMRPTKLSDRDAALEGRRAGRTIRPTTALPATPKALGGGS